MLRSVRTKSCSVADHKFLLQEAQKYTFTQLPFLQPSVGTSAMTLRLYMNAFTQLAFQKCSVYEECSSLVSSDSPAEHAEHSFIHVYMKLHYVLIEEKICFISPSYVEELCLTNSCNACKFSETSGLGICYTTSLLKYQSLVLCILNGLHLKEFHLVKKGGKVSLVTQLQTSNSLSHAYT